jgi:proton glutamate symport protein
MKKIALHWQILIALVAAVFFGIYYTEYVGYIGWMGAIFMRALKMVIVPLILTSVMSGVANLGSGEGLGKMGAKTISYYMLTSLLAIVTGLVLVNIIQPGIGADLGLRENIEGLDKAKESFGNTLLNIVPKNIFSAFMNGDMLSIIFFALLSGYFITKLKGKQKDFLLTGVNAGFELMMKITGFIIKFTPYGVFGIVAVTIGEKAGDGDKLYGIMQQLGWYMLTVILALLIHFAFTMPVLLKLLGNINPLSHIKAMRVPLLTAFSTSSSSATLPLTIEACENNACISNKTTSFVLPLGATINMDGTALYECVAVIFIAQAYGIDLSFGQQVVVVFTALLASIGAAGIPMAGLVMMSVVLNAVGLPQEGIGLIIAVDRILDMFRTTINVWSDSCGAAIIATSEGEKLKYT